MGRRQRRRWAIQSLLDSAALVGRGRAWRRRLRLVLLCQQTAPAGAWPPGRAAACRRASRWRAAAGGGLWGAVGRLWGSQDDEYDDEEDDYYDDDEYEDDDWDEEDDWEEDQRQYSPPPRGPARPMPSPGPVTNTGWNRPPGGTGSLSRPQSQSRPMPPPDDNVWPQQGGPGYRRPPQAPRSRPNQ